MLEAYPAGLTEYSLLERLSAGGLGDFDVSRLSDPLALFRQHFMLFHLLYRLRDELRGRRAGDLAIHCLEIRLLPYTSGQAALGRTDTLRAYYLDLQQLGATDRDAVRALLTGFWRRLGADDRRAQALEVLELADPVDAAAIKRQYRRLAMRHHPDRGGDTERLQAINQAMTVLTDG